MKTTLLLITGASLGIATYILFFNQGEPASISDQAGAWGTGQRLSGAGNFIKGGVKKAFGKATDDPSIEASGLVDKVKGAAQDAIGSAAQTVSDAAHNT